jgi:hypothetical protein
MSFFALHLPHTKPQNRTQDEPSSPKVPVSSARLHPSTRAAARIASALLFALLATTAANAQNLAHGILHEIESAPAQAKAVQPDMACPFLVFCPFLSNGNKEQFTRQKLSTGAQPWNLGGGFGPLFILTPRMLVAPTIPKYVINDNPRLRNGFGDAAVMTQLRLFSGNKDHGNYTLDLAMQHTWPTGNARNGNPSATSTYWLAGGKAVKAFNVQSSLGRTSPAAAGIATLGHPIAWNTAFQYRATKLLWMDFESNTTFFRGGAHAGLTQSFVTPGIIARGIHPRFFPARNRLVFGAAMEVATTRFHTSNHNLILDWKFSF